MNCDNNKARRQVGVSIRAISNWIWFHSSRMFWRNECLNEMETNSDWNWARMKRGLKGMEKINLNCWFELIWIHAAHSSRPSLIFAFFNSMLRRKLKRCRASVFSMPGFTHSICANVCLFPAAKGGRFEWKEKNRLLLEKKTKSASFVFPAPNEKRRCSWRQQKEEFHSLHSIKPIRHQFIHCFLELIKWKLKLKTFNLVWIYLMKAMKWTWRMADAYIVYSGWIGR